VEISTVACALALTAFLGCGESPTAAPVSPTTAKDNRPERTPGPMADVHPTRMGDALSAVGLDVKNLPPLETLNRAQRMRVMKTFTEALGTPCIGCHAEEGFTADTKRKRIAKRMYNELARTLALEDGAPVYCDSCHDGKMFVLDRRDRYAVATYMENVLVGKMKRVDGRDHDCGTCHGDPPDFRFLSAWKASRAPDIDPTMAYDAPLPPAANTYSPTTTACAKDGTLCPLQRWMRERVAPALASGDADTLASALEETARFSPAPDWRWEETARRGAAAARAGDLDGAAKSCFQCHDAYKKVWRSQYRTRAGR
jgi:hypothetical protein